MTRHRRRKPRDFDDALDTTLSDPAETAFTVLAGPAPCDGCFGNWRCKSEKLACSDFAHFVATGRTIDGSRQANVHTFRRLFSADGDR